MPNNPASVSVGYADPSALRHGENVLVRRMSINGRCMSMASTATSQCRTAWRYGAVKRITCNAYLTTHTA
ncbi:hypothetical protein KCP71_02205 [Salmonella enterica subsp. enterica]|nr:hypothetical protein KCP71_02205 [Salmonella enterica subsp. enterica]